MKSKLKVGIISAGAISCNHIEGYRKAGAEVIAICDPVQAVREARAQQYNIPAVYASVEELLANKEITAVSVCSPNYVHAPITIQALRAGKHVLVEKPMAMSVAEAAAMVAAAKKARRLLMCGHNLRFSPDTRKVVELRTAGAFGNIYHAKCAWIRRRGIPGLGRWFTTRAQSGGGPLIDIGIHVIDRTWYMMGMPRPVAVCGTTASVFGRDIPKYVCAGMWAGPRDPRGVMDVEDFASAFIRFANGATMTVEVSWAANREEENIYSILMGEKLGALINSNGITLYGERGNSIATEKLEFDGSSYPDRQAHFVNCLRDGAKCICTGDDGLAIQKILNGIYTSSAQRREVRIR